MPASRRELLSRALAGGAGTLVIQPFAPGSGIASNVSRRAVGSDPSQQDVDDPGFADGRVAALASGGIVTLVDSQAGSQNLRLGDHIQAWKAGRFNAEPVTVGDSIYARGELDAAGVLEVDRLWANIVSLKGTVAGARASELVLSLDQSGVEQRLKVARDAPVSNPNRSETSVTRLRSCPELA